MEKSTVSTDIFGEDEFTAKKNPLNKIDKKNLIHYRRDLDSLGENLKN